MPKLNIAHHKSYHPYKAENIEKVRRDEERAEAIEAGDKARVMQADSEARIAMLRKKSKKGKSKEEDEAEKALERQLTGKGKEREDAGSPEPESRATIVRPPSNGLDSITTQEGHFNFWADLEKGNPAQVSKPKNNADYEAEKKAEKDKWEDQITMYLQAPPKTWYDSQDRLNPKERKRTEDQRLEYAYKDNEMKRGEDPLGMMQAFLKRREDIKAAQERQKADPWADTPRTLTSDRTPVQPSLLSKRSSKHKDRRRSPSPLADVQAGPARPPQQSPPQSIQQQAMSRESSERERAKALLSAKRKSGSSVASTPRSEFGYQTGMYNREETRQAKGYSSVKWDDDRRDLYRYRR